MLVPLIACDIGNSKKVTNEFAWKQGNVTYLRGGCDFEYNVEMQNYFIHLLEQEKIEKHG